MKRFFNIYCFLLCCFYAVSQDNMFYRADIIEIEASAEMDTLHSTIDHVLNQLKLSNNGVVQSNGPGLLSTFLIRGLAARHTGIIWNDWSIQSSVNSTYDLSLIPNHFYNLGLEMGSQGAGFGNGAFAGVIKLKSREYKEKFAFSSHINSIGNTTLASNMNIKLNRTNIRLGLETVNNNNRYQYIFNRKKLTQAFAPFENYQVHLDLDHSFSSKDKIGFNVWHQLAYRFVAPSKTSVYNNDKQRDQNTRANFYYQRTLNQSSHKISFAYFNENLRYRSNQINNSLAISDVYLARQMSRYFLSSNQVLTHIIDFRLDQTEATFFNENYEQNNLGLAVHYQHDEFVKGFDLITKIRTDINSITGPQLTYNIQFSKDLSNSMELNLSSGRSFQNPGYNDLYWPEGGNEDLKTEVIYDTELGFDYTMKNISLSTSLFYNYIDNWIQWTPVTSLFWSPTNISKVNSYGFDLNSTYQNKIAGIDYSGSASYAFVRSIILEHKVYDELDGKQLIYIPQHKLNMALLTSYKSFHISGDFSWMSKRYISRDNKNEIDGYSLINAQVYYENSVKKGSLLRLGLQCNNLTNSDYEVVKFYAMPLRYFGVFINYNLL